LLDGVSENRVVLVMRAGKFDLILGI
jgi:hypothetical protein